MVAVVPSSVASVLVSTSLVGFSGSRSVVPAVAGSVASLVSCPVVVGCAGGVDGFFRDRFPSASVFSVSISGRSGFAVRSVEFVRCLSTGGGVLVSFPSRVCPVGLLPSTSSSRCFCGLGSGSWGSLAFAVGLGVHCLVFAPFGVPSGWGFTSCGGGWFQFVSSGCQLGLF